MKGIEPSSSAWKAVALPLSYTRICARDINYLVILLDVVFYKLLGLFYKLRFVLLRALGVYSQFHARRNGISRIAWLWLVIAIWGVVVASNASSRVIGWSVALMCRALH